MFKDSTSVSLTLEYNERFRNQVLNDRPSPDPMMDSKLSVDDTSLISADLGLGAAGYMTTVLCEHLSALKSLRDGNPAIVTYPNGPTWLALRPKGSSVELTHCLISDEEINPAKRHPASKSAIVSLEAWEDAVLDTAEEYYQRMNELNPSVESDAQFQSLREMVDELKENN